MEGQLNPRSNLYKILAEQVKPLQIRQKAEIENIRIEKGAITTYAK